MVDYKTEAKVKCIGNFNGFKGGNYAGNVYYIKNLSPTLNTCRGGNTQVMIAVLKNGGKIMDNAFAVAQRGRDLENPSRRGPSYGKNQQRLELSSNAGVSNTLTSVDKDSWVMTVDKSDNEYVVRKLTEGEYFRLMGFELEDCQKCKDVGISKSQLYKQAGNGIMTSCIKLLIQHLYKAQYYESFICYDEEAALGF